MTKPAIVVERYPSDKDWTLSEFYINGEKRGYGVEDEYRPPGKKVRGETRIPNGIYELDLRVSPKFSHEYYMDASGRLSKFKTDTFNKEHEMIWVTGVPDFDLILWHWGNSDDNTDGCYLVGSSLAQIADQMGVGASRPKYVEVYPEIRAIILAAKARGEKALVEYKDKEQKQLA